MFQDNVDQKTIINKEWKEKTENKKIDQKLETENQTVEWLKQIEEELHSNPQELKKLEEEIIQNKESNKNLLKEIKNIQLDTWLTITDFDDIFDDIIDDYEDLKKKFPFLSLKQIAIVIKNNRLKLQKESQKWQKISQLSPLEEWKKAILEIIFWKQIETNNKQQNFIEQINIIAYIIQNFDKLDDEKKKKFLKRFQEILAHYLEWKIIEVYEITIQDWQIIIKWKWTNWQTVIVKLDSSKIWKQNMQKIFEFIQKYKEKIFKKANTNKQIWEKHIYEKIELWNNNHTKNTKVNT